MEKLFKEYMELKGWKVAGSVWGENFWKILSPKVVASIASAEPNTDGTSPPLSFSDRMILTLCVEDDKESQDKFGADAFATFASDLADGNVDAPSEVMIQYVGKLNAVMKTADCFQRALS